MRREDIKEPLSQLAFEFFYRFSRFEFALTENGYLRFSQPGRPAIPGWFEFARERCGVYRLTADAAELIDAAPKRQVVAANGCLEWEDVDLKGSPSELGNVIQLLKTVRNNLFHGGKHGAEGWDDPVRTERLLTLGAAVLDQIAKQTGLEGDYYRFY